MTDPELVKAAIEAAGLSARRFAALVELDERKLRRILDGDAPSSGVLRVVCRAIVARPGLAAELAAGAPPSV